MILKINNYKIIYLFISLFLIISCYLVIHFMVSEKPEPPLTLTISSIPSQSFALLYIAMQEGYFNEQNLTVNIRNFPITSDSLADCLSGNSDLATITEIPFIEQVSKAQDVSAVSTLSRSKNTSVAIVGLKSKKIYSGADLKGKKIAVVKSTNTEYVLYSILMRYKINLKDVKLIFTDIESIPKLLNDGTVDAASTSGPTLYSIENSHAQNDLTTIYPETYIGSVLLVGKDGTIRAKGEEIKRLLNALVKAQDFAHKNQSKSIEDVAISIPTVPQETIKNLWPNYELTLSLDNVLLEILNSEFQVFQEINYATPTLDPIDFKNRIFSDYLKKISPKDVTIF